MHTEHLNNVRLGYVLVGWLVAIAFTSLFLLGFIALNLINPEGDVGSGWITLAGGVGFALGGAVVGFRTALAPILHGVMMGITSIVVWALLNAIAAIFFPDFRWGALSAPIAVNVILVQIVCAILGTRFGYRYAVARTP
jgi:hypothetical protein